MAEIALAVAQTLFAALQCSQLKEICTVWKYETHLEELKKTVETIKNVLKDAESKLLTSEEEQGYIKELKDAVYDADDLFDEFVTLLESNQLKGSRKKHGKFIQKVRNFLSSDSSQVINAYTMFKEVEKIQIKLEGIVGNHKNFALGVDYKPICMKRDESCSYVDFEIVGRDNDKVFIINQLLEKKEQDVCFLTIFGVGGLGKTALAQLVFNDVRLKQEFGNSMFWICVSDQDKKSFDVKAILCKTLELATGENSSFNVGKELVYQQFKNTLGGKKYFLVLDDVWNEDREKWIELQNILMLGQGGSRILVTTRSEVTATVIGDGQAYKLQGLSPEESWHLFEIAAFKKGSYQPVVKCKMEEIGRKIVKRCSNIPLAIKVVGSLLFGQHIEKWSSFEEMGLGQIDNGENKIIDVLKLSYYNLCSSLKSCFSYCAVFPKDFELERNMLIRVWIAQGYIVPLHGGQTIEDAAEEHFSILLRRCFFQDVKKDEYDDVSSVKIHDLMHDVAQEVGGKDIQVGSSIGNNTGTKTFHMSLMDIRCFQESSNWPKLRSLIHLGKSFDSFGHFQIVIDNCKSLRVLDLKLVDVGSSLKSISKLHHLRYLDLSCHSFNELPNSITKLHNLQTLYLYRCDKLRQLPHEFSKLGKLKHLDVTFCYSLTCMPWGLNKLTSLKELTYFVVGRQETLGKECDDELKDLGTLTNLTGCIIIYIGPNYKSEEAVMKDMNGGYLNKLKHLKQVDIRIHIKSIDEAEAVLEKLEPHPNLKGLMLSWYQGTTIPWWRRVMDNWPTSLPNLVSIRIDYCHNLVSLPSIHEFPYLKSLVLENLDELEYMVSSASSSVKEAIDTTFFPSLEYLKIENLVKWKGWLWEGTSSEGDNDLSFRARSQFPSLSKLKIARCPNLVSFPPCPRVINMKLYWVNKTSQLMKKMMMVKEEEQGEVTVGTSLSSSCLATLAILGDNQLESLSEFESTFKACASSLQRLEIRCCSHLTTLSGGLEHLTSLQSLDIISNPALNFSEDSDDDMPWKSLHQSLQSLNLYKPQNMRSLPKGIQYLTNLKTLKLEECYKLEGFPEWMSCLSSLHSLLVHDCDEELEERCQKPNGEDWQKIKHIPKIKFSYQCKSGSEYECGSDDSD